MKNILILDDDPVILEIIKDELAKSGKYNILLASNGVEGLGVLESNSIDILITDLLMPEFDGIQLISYMKENQINIPVLVITSVDDTDVIDQIKNLGIADILKKPIDFNELEQKISFAIKKRLITSRFLLTITTYKFSTYLLIIFTKKPYPPPLVLPCAP